MDSSPLIAALDKKVSIDTSKLSLDNIIKNIKNDQINLDIDIRKNNIDNKYFQVELLGAEIIKPEDFYQNKEFSVNKIDTEGTQMIYDWKLIESYPSRLLKIYDKTILLELVIDHEEGWVEEREFKKNLFKKLNLKNINFFKVQCYERPGEERLVIEDGSGMVKESDFPEVDFSKFSNADIFF